MTYHYYRIEPGTEASQHVARFRTAHAKRASAHRAAAKAMALPKGVDAMSTSHAMVGAGQTPFSPPIEGWAWSKKWRCNVPDRKTPRGKELVKIMATVPAQTDWMRESKEIFGHGMLCGAEGGGLCIRFASFAWSHRGAVCYMHSAVKKAVKTWPKGMVEITASEAEEIVPSKSEE